MEAPQKNNLTEGSRVKCMAGDIDKRHGEGKAGVVDGFARFSKYHPREAHVSFDDGTGGGWFWLCDLQSA